MGRAVKHRRGRDDRAAANPSVAGVRGDAGPDHGRAAGSDRLLRLGIVGTVVLALCCFTPLLVVLLGALGLSAALGWLDLVLLPALALFIAITVYALWRRRRRA